ncbi:hypothetical protein [Brevundimonas sp. DC300-4]|uniref:hypothetical protein n=1 Tax=Brevundimonas sp. DC300-4 TaxID=2804594 RepID=UPI003CF257DE
MRPPRFQRAAGLTPSERLLAEIADRSFLKLWTYPNPYKELNRELADLIVVFGDDVLLFSDKGGAYPESGDQTLDWTRYYRSAITQSAAQLRTAEHWIRRSPDRVYLDVRCTERLPVALPPAARVNIHRICVAPAATEAARARAGVDGLAIDPGVAGDERLYTVGQVQGCQGWVHVFDEDTLAAVMPALSTTPDFIAYLRAKEALIGAGGLAYAASEKDLLAIYLANERGFPDRLRPLTAPAGTWNALIVHPQFRAAQALNLRAAVWDSWIDRITVAAVNNDLVFGNDVPIQDIEKIVRIMAAEDRFDRRVLSEAVMQRAVRALDAKGKVSSLVPSQANADVVYVLLVAHHDLGRESYEDYREARRLELYLRCKAAVIARPNAARLVGLGLDTPNGRGGSEDFIYLEAADLTADERAAAAAMRQDLGYFIEGQVEVNRVVGDEYPDI